MDSLRILMVYANSMMDNLIPVGVSSLMGALKSSGLPMELELFDTTFYRTEEQPSDADRAENLQVHPFSYEEIGLRLKDEDVYNDFRKHVLRFKPHIVMLSIVESTLAQGISLLQAIKDIRPYVVAGGVFAAMAPEIVISQDVIDAICIGEGEVAAVEFCRRFAAGEDVTRVAGMWFKKNGEVVKNPLGPLVNINAMPFLDLSLFPKERFYKPMQGRVFRMVPIEFSRGCPYHCTYCANHAWEALYKGVGRWYRWKTMDRIFAEIDHYLSKYQAEFFYFISESFLAMPREKFNEFCERYSNYKIPFWFNTRPETITKEQIKKLEEINCFRIGVGLEHGNPEFRARMLKRRAANEKIIEGCRYIEQSKISFSVNNIIGLPEETRDLVFETIRLNKQIRSDSVQVFVFTPFRGTDIYDYCIQHGYINPDTPVGDLHRISVLKNTPMTGEEIRGILRTFPLYVHFPEKEYPLIKRAERFDKEGNEIFRTLAERYSNEFYSKEKL